MQRRSQSSDKSEIYQFNALNSKFKRQHADQNDQRAKECLIKIEELKEKYQGMQNDSTLSWLPMDYRSSFCISEIATYVQNGRADTLKEAINLFETEQHNQRLENAASLGAYWGVLTGSLY